MTEPVVFAPIAAAIATHLKSLLIGRQVDIPVVVSVPTTRPTRFVRVRRIGGGDVNLITDEVRVVAECWDTSGARAEELATLVRALLVSVAPGRVGTHWVDRARCVGFTDLPDPGTNLPRYLVTVELLVTGAALA